MREAIYYYVCQLADKHCENPSSLNPTTTMSSVGSSSILQFLSDDGLRILLATCTTIGGFLCGIGLERSIGRRLVFVATDTTKMVYYNLLILAWPILLLIGLLSFSVFGLPFTIFGLFYGGIPFLSHDFSVASDVSKTRLARVLHGGKLAGNALHHSSFLLVCSLISVRQVVPNRYLLSAGIPLLVMHVSELLAGVAPKLYYALVLLSEVWFQCEAFAALPTQPTEMKVAFIAMIAAHLLFLTSAGVLMIFNTEKASDDMKNAGSNPNHHVLRLTHYLRNRKGAFQMYDDDKDADAVVDTFQDGNLTRNYMTDSTCSLSRRSTPEYNDEEEGFTPKIEQAALDDIN